MANNMTTLKIRMPDRSEFERVGAWFHSLPEEKRDQFQREWDALKDAGAEVADAGYAYGVVHCWISDDFQQHCRRFGLDIKQG